MTHADDPQSVALSYYAEVLRRRWWVPAVGALLGIAAALGALAVVPTTATATSTARVNVISNDPFNPSRTASALLDMNGEAQMAASHLVAERAVEDLGGDYTASEVRAASDATVVADTAVLRVSATDRSEERARAIADAVATAYLEVRSEQAQARIDRQVDSSRERLEQLRGDLAVLNATLATAKPDSEEALQAETDRSLVLAEIDSVLSQQATTQSIDTTGGAILNPAAVATVQYDPNRGLILATGMLGGLGAGLATAFVVHALGARVRAAGDVARHTGRPVLGVVPGSRLAFPFEGEAREELRVVRERMLADPLLASRVGVTAVIGASGLGASVEAACGAALGEQLAEAGVDVLLVPVGLDEGEAESLLSMLGVVAGRQVPGQARRYTGGPGDHLAVLLPPEGTEAAAAPVPAVQEQVGLESQERLVVVLVPGSATRATRMAVCRQARTAVLLVARRETRVSDLRRLGQDVRQMGGQLLGSVLLPRRAEASPSEDHLSVEDPSAVPRRSPNGVHTRPPVVESTRHQPSDSPR